MNSAVHLIDDERLGGVMTNLSQLIDTGKKDHDGDQSINFVNSRHPYFARHFGARNIVVHFSIAWAKLPFLIALRLKNPKSRLILQEHHYSPEHFKNRPRAKKRFQKLLLIASVLFDRILSVSKPQAKWYQAMGLRMPSVIEPMASIDQLLKLPIKPASNKLVIGVSGRLNRTKGIDLALELLSSPVATNFNFLFAGYGELAGQVKAAANIHCNVQFMGPYERAEDYLTCCDLVLIPSRLDTFGLAALEAKAAGKPIVVAKTCGLTDQATDCGVAVEPDCVEAIAEGLVDLLDNHCLSDLGNSARRSAALHNPVARKQWAIELKGT